jgi:hypothetical protein
MIVKAILMVETSLTFEEYQKGANAAVQRKLDAFREAALPSQNWDLTFYRPSKEDLKEMAEAECLNGHQVLTVSRKRTKRAE